MEAVLLELLQSLEAIENQYRDQSSRPFDDQVCMTLSEDIFYGFIKPDPNYQLPDAFGMPTEEADILVREALTHFFQGAHQAAQQFRLDTFQKRSEAFKNPNVRTVGGRDYEDFFDMSYAEYYDKTQSKS